REPSLFLRNVHSPSFFLKLDHSSDFRASSRALVEAGEATVGAGRCESVDFDAEAVVFAHLMAPLALRRSALLFFSSSRDLSVSLSCASIPASSSDTAATVAFVAPAGI